ncbi:tetratricopeptide repeat protein [Rhizobium acaciae]|uniref:tetratricopeptide repeat protein n=1 Tax=Rhizobium acaciae TaxID=2989736 RepID=UPI002220F42D|nr:hypothetical protein [Rhizobium acaciae]MCW1751152.1 hypothetical protein [Rhizobium acaciae]
MGAEIDDESMHDVNRVHARDALDRLLADTRFKIAGRQKAILSYLVARRFEEDVKAYVIAVDVLGRPSNFDATIDPIVRIEMSRLRSTLESFYAAFGDDHDIWISITKGKYVACFTRRSSLASEDIDGAEVVEEQHQPAVPADGNRRRQMSLWTVGKIACGTIAVLGGYAYASRPTISEKPIVYVSVEAADPKQTGEASQMRDSLLTALTQFQTLIVAQPGYASVRSRGADARYAIHLKYYGDNDKRGVWWQVIESSSGKLQMAGLEEVETTGKNTAAVREEVVTALARRIASSRGVINSIELVSDTDSLGNGCIIRAEYAFEIGRGLDAAIDCLRRTVRLVPEDSDAKAVLARALLVPEGRATPPEVTDHALNLARDAVARAPLSGRAQLALMTAWAAKGSMQTAIEAGNRAISLNPYSSDAAAALGGVLYSAGYRAAGLSMAMDASKDVDVVPRCALLVQALDAFRNARYTEALMWIEQVNGITPLAKLIRSAALGELGSEQARVSLQDADVSPTGFKKTIDAVGLQPDMVSMLERGLSKAGADLGSVGSISR